MSKSLRRAGAVLLMIVGTVIAIAFTGPLDYVFGTLSVVPILVGVCVGLAGYVLLTDLRPPEARAGRRTY